MFRISTAAFCRSFTTLEGNISEMCLQNYSRILYIPKKCIHSKYSGIGKTNNSLQTPLLARIRTFFTHRPLFERASPKRTGINSAQNIQESFKNQYNLLIRPLAFATVITATSFTGAAIWQYESLRARAQNYFDRATDYSNKAGSFRQHISSWWNNLTSGQRVIAGIIALNIAVFGMWKVPALQPIMVKYFCSSPVAGAPCLSMLLSTFSHYSFLHMAINMYVLWSFASVAVGLFGKEQFVAMYLSAGVISTFTSYALKIFRGSAMPSLGASGAILAVLGAVCQSYPDSRLSIAFISELIPHSFSAQAGMYGIVAFDTTGVLFNLHFFDHAAHLGGMLFGMWYAKYGHIVIWKKREFIVKVWHDLRNGKPAPPSV